ncbi:MAG: hypothetical protein V8R67_00955 [Eubacterium sp.]
MKKILVLLLSSVFMLCLVACGSSDTKEQTKTEKNSTKAVDNANKEDLSKWEMAGKGVGKILPEPEKEYNLPQSSEFISAEIEDVTYDFFEDYVNKCIEAGFEGSIGTAKSPDYYYNGKTTNGETVQVMYYKSDKKCSISAFPAKK